MEILDRKISRDRHREDNRQDYEDGIEGRCLSNELEKRRDRASIGRVIALSCRVVSTCAEFVRASSPPREFNASSLRFFHETASSLFTAPTLLHSRYVEWQWEAAPHTRASTVWHTFRSPLLSSADCTEYTKRVRARPYSRHGVVPHAWARIRGDAMSLSKPVSCLETCELTQCLPPSIILKSFPFLLFRNFVYQSLLILPNITTDSSILRQVAKNYFLFTHT